MPRASSTKRKYYGNRYCDTGRKKTPDNIDLDVDNPTLGSHNLSASIEPSLPVSASKRKLSFDNIYADKFKSETSSNVILDLELLSEFIKNSSRCKVCDSTGSLKVTEDVPHRNGLASKMVISCTTCDYTNSAMSSKMTRKRLYEVNVRYTYGMRSIGKGKKGAQMLAAVLNLPKPSTRQTHYTKIIGEYVKVASEASMRDAVLEAVEENFVVDKPGRLQTDIPVALDGSWHKRGHTSLNGVVTATSVDGGKVIDLECMTKFCVCKKNERGQKLHEHCAANYLGTSGGMEVEGAVRIFNRSEATRRVRYVDYLGDGDSKGFKKVVESKPYGDGVCIEKLECVGHVQKRMGARLMKVVAEHKGKKLSDGKRIGGKGRLSKEEIDKLQKYYGNAIRRNSNDLANMKRDVWAIYFHKLSSDEKPQHSLCPAGEKSWCHYNRSLVTKEKYSHQHSLPEPVMLAIKNTFKDLANEELLKKCLHGKTQNCNESFNNVIWTRLPKTVFVGIDTLKFGAYDAALCFNKGNVGKLEVFQLMGIQAGRNTVRGLCDIDEERIDFADIAALAATKQARQSRRTQKKRKEDAEDELEVDDPSYGAGTH